MPKKYYFYIVVLVIIALLIYFVTRNTIQPHSDDEQTAVNCGNKTVFRYKYPSKIFPVIINDYTSSFSIVSTLLNKIAADTSGSSGVSSQASNTAKQLRDTLNQDNIFFENNLKAYFLASNDDPCNDSLRYMYAAYIKDMTEKVIEMKQLIAQVSTPQVNTSKPVNHDSVIAVIDTGKATPGQNTTPGENPKLVIKKDYTKINSVLDNFQQTYKTTTLRKIPLTTRIHQ